MQTESGRKLTLDQFTAEMNEQLKAKGSLEPELANAEPFMHDMAGQIDRRPEGAELAKLNEEMKARGWSRAQRRRYLSNKKGYRGRD